MITTAEQVASKSAKVVKAQEQGVHIVSEDWLVESIKAGKKADEKSHALGEVWGFDHCMIKYVDYKLRFFKASSGDKRKKDEDEAPAGTNGL